MFIALIRKVNGSSIKEACVQMTSLRLGLRIYLLHTQNIHVVFIVVMPRKVPVPT